MGLGTVNALVRLPLHHEQTYCNLLPGKPSRYWLMGDESQTVSLLFHKSVEQDEYRGCGQWLYVNDRFNLVLICSEHIQRLRITRNIQWLKQNRNISLLAYWSCILFWIWPYKIWRITNSANNNHNSIVNREGIVECTKRGKADRQGEEQEKFPTPTKPVQSPAAPLLPDFPSFLPHFTQVGRKWGKHPGISAQLRELKAQGEGVKQKGMKW